MKTTMLKLSTMAMTLLAIGLGMDLPGTEEAHPQAEMTNRLVGDRWLLPWGDSSAVDQANLRVETSAFDLVIIPGHAVGPVTADTTHRDLAKIFDGARLRDVEAPMGEGFTRPGTRVDLGENRSFTVIWADAERSQISEVRDIGSDWRTPEGIQPGISLEELEAILGPFKLSGFAWDYGGTVRLEGTTLDSYESQLIVRLQPTPADRHQTQALREVLGDELVDSDHKSFEQIHPVVDEIIVSLAKPTMNHAIKVW